MQGSQLNYLYGMYYISRRKKIITKSKITRLLLLLISYNKYYYIKYDRVIGVKIITVSIRK